MPPRVPASTNMDFEADGSDLVHACRARLMHACRAADFSVQFPALLAVAEGIGAVEKVSVVNEAVESRVPRLFGECQNRSPPRRSAAARHQRQQSASTRRGRSYARSTP